MSKERDIVSPMMQQFLEDDKNPDTLKWAIAGSIYITLLLMWLPLPGVGVPEQVRAKKVIKVEHKHKVLNVAKPVEVEHIQTREARDRQPVPVQVIEQLVFETRLDLSTPSIAEVASVSEASGWEFTADTPAPPLSNDLNRPLSSDYPGLVKPVFMKKVAPNYPRMGERNRLQGTVLLRAILREDGTIDDIEVLRQLAGGRFGFEAEAIKAVKQWHFKPGSLNGKPVDIEVHLEISFKLN